uniref:Uncharacterized protein n=2 Tax=Meloidogyne TaxID=189290 RepID=A0A914KZN4_MELIC
MSNTFFIHLPSNVPNYSINKPNKFRVQLPKPIHFNGNWVCGLHSITYPYSWPSTIGTLDEQWLKIHFTDDLGQKSVLRIPIPKASHTKVEKLRDFLNATLEHQAKAIDLVFDPDSSKNKSVVSPPRLDRRKRDLESTPSINNLQSPPKASPPISPPRLDRKRKRDLQTPPRIDDLSESQPKINTILKTPPKISPPKVNKSSSIEINKVINIKEKDNVREKDKADEKKIPENEPLNDRQKKSGVAGQTQESNNQTSASQMEINKEENRQRIKSMHVIPPAITPLFALGLPNTENTNNKTVVKDNDNEITIEEDKEGNTDNVDINKFSLWRGGIRLSGNLTLLKNMINSITFEYNIDFGRFFIKINHSNIDYISLSTQLCYVLGFENPQIIKNKDVAKYGSDLRGGFSSFGVYVKGLTEKMIIGDSLSSLLRVVSISGATPGEYNEKIYDTPIYSRVLPKEINDIEVELRTLDNGRLVPFSYGTVLIVLIFRKVINF